MTPMTMQKTEAFRLLGGSTTRVAKACRVTPQAVTGWPDELTDAIEDRVVAALVRKRTPSMVDDALREYAVDQQPISQGA